ncbi:MAG: murein hydrolase activator EnvC family protein [Cyclobacteriaceae bacterium]|jgi:septal ring factor EnvC (AmiA/AmiB activator)
MIAGKRCVLFLLILITAVGAQAQKKSRAQLEKEKKQNLERIQETERILKETTKKKKTSVGELNALSARIQQQEKLIKSIKDEIALLEQDIAENNDIIIALELDLYKLKEEYAAMLYAAQKASGKTDKLLFLFSSRSFDQLLMRLKYMEQYAKARTDQARAIERVQGMLQAQVLATQQKKDEQSDLLSEEEKENTSLTELKQQQRGLVRKLEKEEKQLKRDLEETRKAIGKLDKMIADIIREEMERAAREAALAKEKNTGKAAPEVDIKLSASFEENRNKLGWPANGIISQRFGKHKHPVLKNITLENLGINIQTREGEAVKVVFQGTVKTISANPLLGTTIIVNHGDYFTVYTGLREVYVKSGQKVTANQEIGLVQQNVEGVPELRFRIYKQTTPLDPELWLRN